MDEKNAQQLLLDSGYRHISVRHSNLLGGINEKKWSRKLAFPCIVSHRDTKEQKRGKKMRTNGREMVWSGC